MKKLTLSTILLATVFSFAVFTEVKAQAVSVNFSVFQQELSPYGRWVNSPSYGQVWMYNDVNFRPYYTDGNIPTTAGLGNLTMTGVGHRFIMADGKKIHIMAGCGFLVMNGVQPG